MADVNDEQKLAYEDPEADEAADVQPTSMRPTVIRALVSAVVVALAFQARTMAYNNYGSWNLRFCTLEMAVAIGAACLVRAGELVTERGLRWAEGYATPGSGALWLLLSNLAPAALCAVVMTALLSIANVAVVAAVFYRETVEMLPLEIMARFMADIPLAFVLCLAVRIVLAKLDTGVVPSKMRRPVA